MTCPTPLSDFLATHSTTPLDDLAEVIRSFCRCGAGTWYDPRDTRTGRHPISSEVEIDFLGIHARGLEPLMAAHHWRRAAGYAALIDEAMAAGATP